jgi:hypothetical protein
MRRPLFVAFVFVAAWTGFAAPAHAGWEAGGHLVYAEPRADFAAVVRRAYGIQGFGVLHLDPLGFIGLRGGVAFLNYGNERVQVPLSSTVRRVLVDVTTSNNIGALDLGLEIAAPAGPARPYLFGAVGIGYFFTESSVAGANTSDEPFASSRNFDDIATGSALGGGVRIPIAARLALDLGLEYRR